jgi:Zn-finger nucleic acid-binding protein
MSYREAQPPGFEITPELKTWETPHRCPRCLCEIYAGEKDEFRIEACGRCGGVWVTGEVAKRALATGSRAIEDLALKVEGVTQRVVQQEVTALLCPECGVGMEKSTIGAAHVDTCKVHGTWFDPHELHTALVALKRMEQAVPTEAADEAAAAAAKMRPGWGGGAQAVAERISYVIDRLDSALKVLTQL